MADNEPVVAPDQLKPGPRKAGRIGAIVTALLLLSCIIGNHEGNVENVFLVVSALGLIGVVVADAVLRRSGLRS